MFTTLSSTAIGQLALHINVPLSGAAPLHLFDLAEAEKRAENVEPVLYNSSTDCDVIEMNT